MRNVMKFNYFCHNNMVIVSVTTSGYMSALFDLFITDFCAEFECFSLELTATLFILQRIQVLLTGSVQHCTVTRNQHCFLSKPVLSSEKFVCAVLIRADKQSALHSSNE